RRQRPVTDERTIMDHTDKTLVCADCQAEFVFTAAEQQKHAERGYTNDPKRCPDCRAKRRASGPGGGGGGFGGGGGGGFGGGPDRGGPGSRGGMGGPRGSRESFPATCAACGKPTTVPFKPTEGRPVYCRDCFQSKRS